jgi:hypothetical protein
MTRPPIEAPIVRRRILRLRAALGGLTQPIILVSLLQLPA